MPEFDRPQGWDFAFGGVNLRTRPDAIAINEYACAQNIRGVSDKSIQTRPGYVSIDSGATGVRNDSGAGSLPITDIRAYSALGTDNLPRFLCRDTHNHIIIDSGAIAVTLAGAVGSGVFMIPFRPNQSPQSWMYVCGLGDYQKISDPHTVSGSVTSQKVGIAEPQTACDFAPGPFPFIDWGATASDWTPSGAAGATSGETNTTDTVVAIFADPIVSTRYSVQIGTSVQYRIGELLKFYGSVKAVIQDVLPPVASTLTIKAIRYVSGTSGACTIVTDPLSVESESQIATLRRGSLVKIDNTEVVMVLSVVFGADGSTCFETVTSGSYSVTDTVEGVPAVIVDGITSAVVGHSVTSSDIASTLTPSGSPLVGTVSVYGTYVIWRSGSYFDPELQFITINGVEYRVQWVISTTNLTITASAGTETDVPYSASVLTSALTQTFAESPFIEALGNNVPQVDDYIHISLYADNLLLIKDIRVIFSVDSGVTPDYQSNIYYYLVSTGMISALVPVPLGSPSANWYELMFPISALTHVGPDETRTLANCVGVQILLETIATVNLKIGSMWIGGGGEPDVGNSGAEYRYRVVPRSSLTGAIGNASPDPRYGVAPRRQPVTIKLPSAAYDSQIDTWDIYRYGGTVLTWRYVGSAKSTDGTFTDDYFDDAVGAGQEMETDNFEPWPSIDMPYKIVGNTLAVTGTQLVISGPTSWPALTAKWLPGTLIQIVGKGSYTLRSRPVKLSTISYLFELEECAGAYSASSIAIYEPKVARAPVPYAWGPNEQGNIFAAGDPLRPGNVYYCKSQNPDSAPDANNIELCPPSEPLIGGAIMGGISFVASTDRWWALYPSFSYTAQLTGAVQGHQYTPIEQMVGRGLVAPCGHCSDGQAIYFWAKDCIAVTQGGAFKSLTDAHLYPLFPHEGVSGHNVTRNGVTYYAPDYSRAATFRLARASNYLYADYQDSDGNYHTLVCDVRNGAWSSDKYRDEVTCHYAVEQQEGTLVSTPELYPMVVMGDTKGNLWNQIDGVNDNGAAIGCVVATFEWDGGDRRAKPLFGDAYTDLKNISPITITPVSLGVGVATPTLVPVIGSGIRQFVVVAVDGGEELKFLGLQYNWSE